MVTVNNSDYYNNIPAGRDLNKLPNNSSAGIECMLCEHAVVMNKNPGLL